MMKKFFVVLIGVNIFINLSVYAYTVNDKASISVDDKQINWSFLGLSDVLGDLLKHHCVVNIPELYVLSDFIYKQKPYATIKEIRNACESNSKFQKVLFKYATKSKEVGCPDDGATVPGFEQKSGPAVKKSSCRYYIEMLIAAQNKAVDSYAEVIKGKAGFFVKKAGDKYGGVYKVIDFVHSGDLSQDSNVTVIDEDNSLKKLKFTVEKIEINDKESVPLLVNISTSGNTTGIHSNSYIYPNIDLTQPVLALCSQNRVTNVGEYVFDMIEFYPGNRLDVKNTFCNTPSDGAKWAWGADVVKNLRFPGQTDTECNANGVIFNNKIVTLQWLGHFLYGCKETVVDGKRGIASQVYQKTADFAQSFTNRDAKGQAKDDGVFKNAQDEGRKVGRDSLVFSSSQTRTPEKAIEYVKNYMVNSGIVKNKNDVQNCQTTKCKSGINTVASVVSSRGLALFDVAVTGGEQDYVMCTAGNKIYHYEFDDICNMLGDKNIPQKAKIVSQK